MTQKQTTYYHILGLTPHVTDRQVRNAYLRLALRYHPDRNNTASARARFSRINQAYTMLKTKPQRQAYNRRLRESGTLPAPARKSARKPARTLRAFAAALLEIFCPIALNRKVDHG